MEKVKAIKNSSSRIEHEAFGKVAYMWGILSSELSDEAKEFDWDELAIQCENIVISWSSNNPNYLIEEEEGYIMKYAERVILEKFGKKE